MTWHHEIPWLALGLFGLCLVNECGEPANAQTWTPTEQEVLIARLTANEGSFRESDVAAIAYARARYSVERLRRDHPRALAIGRTDARRWIETLPADGVTMPIGWPEERVSWERVGRPGWQRTLAIVHDVVSGRRVPCDERPHTWAGTMDTERMEHLLARGAHIVRCGGTTANRFLRYGGRQ